MSTVKEGTKAAKNTQLGLLVLVFVALVVALEASDRVGIYGLIDKVVFEPNAESPERVQLWGTFAIATRNDRNLYDPAAPGYLYFKLSDDANHARTEWRDLKALAGTKKIAAFGSRFGQSVRLRAAGESPRSPDAYTLGVGVRVMRSDIDHAPIRALSALISR